MIGNRQENKARTRFREFKFQETLMHESLVLQLQRCLLVAALALTSGWLSVIAATAGVSAIDRSDITWPYRISQWKTENGLPNNTVRCLLQTRDRYLWIGTEAGLARFDGLQFTIFNKATTPEMISDNCVTLAEGPNGALWIGTENGLLLWSHNRFQSIDLGSRNAKRNYIRSLSLGHNGILWVATYDGLCLLDHGRVTHYSDADGLQGNFIHTVFEDGDGNLWVGSEKDQKLGGLQRRQVGAKTFLLLPGEGTTTNDVAYSFVQDSQGSFWWGNNKGAHRLTGDKLQHFDMNYGLSGNRVWRLASCRDSGVLALVREGIPGRQGLQKFDPAAGRFRPISLPDDVNKSDIICVIEDVEEGIWVGTRYNGLLLLRAEQIRSFTSRNGLAHDRVNAVCETRDGMIQVATTEGWFRIKDTTILAAPIDLPSTAHNIYGIVEDRLGRMFAGIRIWPGIIDSELWTSIREGVISGSRFEFLSQNSPINCLDIDGENMIWVGQRDGVTRVAFTSSPRNANLLNPILVTRFSKSDGLSSNDIRCILADHSRNVWLGTHGGGLNRWHNGTFVAFTQTQGLCNDFVQTLYEDSGHALWIGTAAGLNRWQDGHFSRITAKEGLIDECINQILEDDCGFFWLCTPRNIIRASRSDLTDLADGKTSRIHPQIFGEAEGLPCSDISSFQPGACKTKAGQLLIPTAKGVAVIDPKNVVNPMSLRANQVPPGVVIQRVIADEEIIFGEAIPPIGRISSKRAQGVDSTDLDQARMNSATIRLSPGRARTLEIHYTANSFVAPQQIRFEYRLDDQDSSWQDAENRRSAFYTNLRPGTYTFRVRAFNSHGVPSQRDAVFAFSLAPHFYETWPFYISCGLLAVLAGFGLHRVRVGILSKQHALARQLALALERERIAQDMHDDVGSRLTQIGLLTERARRDLAWPEAANSNMEEISQATRRTAEAMDEIVWAVNPRNDTLDQVASYLSFFCNEYLESASIRCRLDIPAEFQELPVSSELRHTLFLVVKEALNNVVKHAQAGEVRISLRLDKNDLTVSVADDGRGFSASDSQLNRNCGGDGVANMRRRIEKLGGGFTLKSEPNRGTQIQFRVQL